MNQGWLLDQTLNLILIQWHKNVYSHTVEPCFAETCYEWTGFHEHLNGINHGIFTLFILMKRTDRMFSSIQTQSDELFLRQASNLLNGLDWLNSLEPYPHQSLKPFSHRSAHTFSCEKLFYLLWFYWWQTWCNYVTC